MTKNQTLALIKASAPKLTISSSIGRLFSDSPKLMKKNKLVISSGVAQMAGDISSVFGEFKAKNVFKKMGLSFIETVIEGNWVIAKFAKSSSANADMTSLTNLIHALNTLGIIYDDKPFAWGAFKGTSRKYRYIAIGPLTKKFNGYGVLSSARYRSIKIKN